MRAKVAAAALGRLAEAMRGHIRGAHGRHEEAVHDLRVGCRRIETLLRLWARDDDTLALRRRVQRVRRAAGGAREQEVVAALLRAGRLGASVIPIGIRRRWAASLERRPATRRLPSSATVDRVAAAVERWAAVLDRTTDRRDRAERRVRRWRRRALARLDEALRSGEPVALHEARLAVKRWRYAEEWAGSGAAPRVASARRWQRMLGALNDRVSLVSFVVGRGSEGIPYAEPLDRLRRASLRALRRRLASSDSSRRDR